MVRLYNWVQNELPQSRKRKEQVPSSHTLVHTNILKQVEKAVETWTATFNF